MPPMCIRGFWQTDANIHSHNHSSHQARHLHTTLNGVTCMQVINITVCILICLPTPADAQEWQKVLTFRKSAGGWTPLENSVAPESALVSSVRAYSHVPNGVGFATCLAHGNMPVLTTPKRILVLHCFREGSTPRAIFGK